MDAMLVFACGLMMALVGYWSISFDTAAREVVDADDETEVVDLEKLKESARESGGGYSKLGVVYEDPETGKLYLVEEEAK